MKYPLELLLLVSLSVGCAFAQGPPIGQLAPEINATLAPQVPVAVGDLIEVRFNSSLSEDLDQEVQVQPSGTATFRDIDEVPVAGFTTSTLDERLEDAYRAQYPGIQGDLLTVSVKVRANRTVTIMGEVGESGEIEIGPGQRMTLVEAIGKSGSFLPESAYLANTLLVRWDAAQQKQIHWKIDARPWHWKSEEPIYLQPWDVIYIPIRPIIRANIWVDNWIRKMIPLPFVRTISP